MKNLSNMAILVLFVNVNFLSDNGRTMRARSSIKFLKALSLGHRICADLSSYLITKLKSPHTIHGTPFSFLSSFICCKKAPLSVPVDGP
jgi:hypothetical protein